MNSFFLNIGKKLEIPKFDSNSPITENIKEPVLKYKNHHSILTIQKGRKNKYLISKKREQGKLNWENETKASQKNYIPTRIIREDIDILVEFSCMNINSAIKSESFTSSLKLADVTPLHKKGEKIRRKVLGQYVICLIWSNIYFFDYMFSNQQCDFRKGYSTQHSLLVILKTWKTSVDINEVLGALLTDLSKVFDCHDLALFTAKLNTYSFSMPALRRISDYLSNRKERTKIENTYSTWLDIIFVVQQSTIIGTLLFNDFFSRFVFCCKWHW